MAAKDLKLRKRFSIPTREPLVDKDGYITRAWAQWLENTPTNLTLGSGLKKGDTDDTVAFDDSLLPAAPAQIAQEDLTALTIVYRTNQGGQQVWWVGVSYPPPEGATKMDGWLITGPGDPVDFTTAEHVATGPAGHDCGFWYPRPDADTTYRLYVTASNEQFQVMPGEGIPYIEFTITARHAAPQVTGFSVVLVDAGEEAATPSAHFKFLLHSPNDPEWWYSAIDGIDCDETFTPKAGAQWTRVAGPTGAIDTDIVHEQLEWWWYPPADQYAKFRAASVNQAGEVNYTDAPTFNLHIPTKPFDGGATPPDPPSQVLPSDTGERALDATETILNAKICFVVDHGADAEIIHWWASYDDGATWEDIGNEPATDTQTMIYFWRPAPPATANWKIKVTTNKGSAWNNPSTAVVSGSFQVAGQAACEADDITAVTLTPRTSGRNKDGVAYASHDLEWTNPSAAKDPNFWYARIRVETVDAAGNPGGMFPDRRLNKDGAGYGKAITINNDGWPILEPPYDTYRLYLYAVSHLTEEETLQTAVNWNGGAPADHFDWDPTDPGGGLKASRMDPSDKIPGSLLADLAVSSAKLAESAVLTSKLALGAVDNNRLANLAVDARVLGTGAVSDSTKIANAAVGYAAIAAAAIGTVHLGTAIIQNAHIQDATIQSAKIASLEASKIQAGTILVGSGGMTFSGTGGASILNGGNLSISPGSIYGTHAYFRVANQGWTITGGVAGQISSNEATASIRAPAYYANGNAGITQAFSIKAVDNLWHQFAVNGGLITSYTTVAW
jgi:hypothetical protein